MRELLRRVHYFLNRRRLDAELADEMEFHREMSEQHGGSPFGNTLLLREESREAWGWTWIERVIQDVRYAARLMKKSPWFTLAATLILAIGIGVNVAAFGFFNLMVLRPLPVRDPETLVRFQRSSASGYASVLPYPEMAFIREHSRTLGAVMAWTPGTLTLDGEKVKPHFVTSNLPAQLGATTQIGRILDSRDDERDASPAVMLSQGFWERRFGADSAVVGRVIRLNGKPVTVVGVASAEFSGLSLETPDMWVPLTRQPDLVDGSRLLTDYAVSGAGVTVWGRLQPGMSPQAAQDELRSLAARLREAHPDDIWENEVLEASAGAYAPSAISAGHHGTGRRGPNPLVPVGALAGALALLILAAACSNLGGLLLARGLTRQREISIRISVGAGKGRLVRQLFTESLLLAMLGSAAGVGLGYVILRGLMTLTGAPPWLDPTPDWRVIMFAAGLAFTSAVLFGLAPAFQVAKQRRQATVARQILIGAQVAASCVLLIVAGLLVRGLNLAAAEHGINYRQVVSIDPGLAGHGFKAAKAGAYLDSLRARLKAAPGVRAVALSTTPPFGNRTVTMGMDFAGRSIGIVMNRVDPEYFAAMELPLLRGRTLTSGDTHAVVVSRSLASIAWPGEDPLGKPFDITGVKHTVVGVAANAGTGQARESLEAYTLADRSDSDSASVLVAVNGSPEAALTVLASVAKGIDPSVLPEVQLMKANYERKLEGPKYSAAAVSILAVVALLLASLGIVGMVSYAVSQRTKEIGIRMALGASPSHVLSIAVGNISTPVALGLIAGIGIALAISQVVRQALFGIGGLDPMAYAGAVGLFGLVAVAASILPARRALRVEPMRTLRMD